MAIYPFVMCRYSARPCGYRFLPRPPVAGTPRWETLIEPRADEGIVLVCGYGAGTGSLRGRCSDARVRGKPIRGGVVLGFLSRGVSLGRFAATNSKDPRRAPLLYYPYSGSRNSPGNRWRIYVAMALSESARRGRSAMGVESDIVLELLEFTRWLFESRPPIRPGLLCAWEG